MPEFRTRLINSDFDTTDDGSFHETAEDAAQSGIVTAIDIARDLYVNGEQAPHIKVIILDGEDVVAAHFVRLEVGPLDGAAAGS
jgi:hypothetical protein